MEPDLHAARDAAMAALSAAIEKAAAGEAPPRDAALEQAARDADATAWRILDPGEVRATSPHAGGVAALFPGREAP